MNTFEIANLVDELGSLSNQLKPYQALQDRHDALRKQLAEYCDAQSSDETTLTGNHFTAVFSKPTTNRTIEDVAGFLSAVGVERFLTAVKVSTTIATKLLSKTDAAQLFVESKGSRRLKAVVERQQPVSPAVEAFHQTLANIVRSVSPNTH